VTAGTEKQTLEMTFQHYIDEHARPKGCYVPRIETSAANLCASTAKTSDPTTLKRADHRAYTEHRKAQGVCSATVRRELAMMSAALNHAHREERFRTRSRSRCRQPAIRGAVPHARGNAARAGDADGAADLHVLHARLRHGGEGARDRGADVGSRGLRQRAHGLQRARAFAGPRSGARCCRFPRDCCRSCRPPTPCARAIT
jgi:hypothetical protein